MPYLLDTNVWVAIMRGKDPALAERVKRQAPADVYSCTIVRAELMFGAHRSADPARNIGLVDSVVGVYPSLPVDDLAADQYAIIRAALESRGTPIGANDYFVASIALANGLTLVTNNAREFSRVPGLTVEDWQAP
jgi:tRNA(fMet)-specific endonuclease VapC